MRACWLIGLCAAAAGGCTAVQGDDSGDGGDAGLRCTSNAQCDDAIDCTVDTCGPDHHCQHTPVDALCDAGQSCVVGRGCITGACTTSADCDDAIDCTVDTCGVGNVCDHAPIDALCTGTLQRCDVTAGCVSAGECVTAADCDDSVECTIDDCIVGNTCQHTASDALCGGGQRCSDTEGCYTPVACTTVADCASVYNFCDGTPRCIPEFGCQPPTSPRVCDDGEDCTTDACDRTAGTNGMCVTAWDCSNTACFDGHPECVWYGCFDLDTSIVQSCALGMVHFNFSRVCISYDGTILSISPNPTGSISGPLTMAPGPTGLDFDASLVLSGGCNEYYELVGTVIDADHFDATWTARYVGDATCGLCAPQDIAVHGTRAP